MQQLTVLMKNNRFMWAKNINKCKQNKCVVNSGCVQNVLIHTDQYQLFYIDNLYGFDLIILLLCKITCNVFFFKTIK